MKPMRFLELSLARQTLVRLCQAINHGSIEDLEVSHSEPLFDPMPVTLRDIKLGSDEGPRPEVAIGDFVLSNEVLRLVSLLDEMGCGRIRHVEVRTGIPRRIVLASQSPKAVGPAGSHCPRDGETTSLSAGDADGR